MPDKTIQTLRDRLQRLQTAKDAYDALPDEAFSYSGGDAGTKIQELMSATADFNKAMDEHGSYVLDLLAEQEAALAEVDGLFYPALTASGVPGKENIDVCSRGLIPEDRAPIWASRLRSRTKEEGVQ